MNKIMLLASVLAATTATFVAPAMAGPFTKDKGVCVGNVSAANLATAQGAFVLTFDEKGPISLQWKAGYEEWTNPVAALSSWNSFREFSPQAMPSFDPKKLTMGGGRPLGISRSARS